MPDEEALSALLDAKTTTATIAAARVVAPRERLPWRRAVLAGVGAALLAGAAATSFLEPPDDAQFLIDGEAFFGAQPVERFAERLDEALGKRG